MSEKRFTFGPVSPDFAMIKDNGEPMDTEEVVDLLNEQQSTINELEKNFDDLVQWATIIAKRNVELDEGVYKGSVQ